MRINDIDILNKIIEVQGCIIQGKDLKTILHKNKSFYLEKTDADVITICMNEHEKVRPEYIMEKNRVFAHLLHQYVFESKTLSWNTFLHNHYYPLMSGRKYYKTNDLFNIFKGLLTKKEAQSFGEDLQMKSAVLMPLFDFEQKETIGIVCYLFCTDVEIDMNKLQNMRTLFQTLLQPLYDKEYSIVYHKVVRIDEDLSLLTEQEKRITKKVLAGKSYSEIAEILNISINTLKTHMKNIFKKYNVNSKIELYNKLNMHQ